MDALPSAIPDWAQLPEAMVNLISQKVKCITDYVRFRAVCSPWRAAPRAPHGVLPHLTPQLPWLMIPYSISRLTVDDGYRLFYDFGEAKIRKIELPDTIGKACCATYRGWLLLVASRGSELFLLNPLTGVRKELPSFDDQVKVLWHHKLYNTVDHLFRRTYFPITKMTFSTDLADPNCVIMVFFEGAPAIFYCKVGDECWTQVALCTFANGVALVADGVYNNEKFYLYYGGCIARYNVNEPNVVLKYTFEAELNPLPKFFVVGRDGVYMVVVFPEVEEATATGMPPRQRIEVYEVKDQEGHMDVQRVANTSEIAIFSVTDTSQYLAVHADICDSVHGGCMYIGHVCPSSVENVVPCYGISMATMEEGNPEPVAVGFSEKLQFSPQSALMWLQPSLH